MEIFYNYRMNTLVVDERELAFHAERARVVEERTQRPAPRPVTSTGSLVTIPAN